MYLKSMHFASSRYEAAVNLEQPTESSEIIEIVSNLKPNFNFSNSDISRSRSPSLYKVVLEVHTSRSYCRDKFGS